MYIHTYIFIYIWHQQPPQQQVSSCCLDFLWSHVLMCYEEAITQTSGTIRDPASTKPLVSDYFREGNFILEDWETLL